MSDSFRHKILSGVLWSGMDRFGTYAINFTLLIILARLLSPTDYGELALTLITVNLCNVFIDAGLGMAIIQKKEIDEYDCNSLFYFNLTMGLVTYAIMFMVAPYVAQYYKNPNLTSYIRVLAIMLPVTSIFCIQRNLLVKRMLFRYNFFINLGSMLISGITGVIMAFLGYGTWALIIQYLLRQICNCFFYCFFIKWFPQLLFSWQRLMVLFQFSWKILCCGILATIYGNIYGLIFGKIYDFSTLSFYEKGRHLPEIGTNVISSTLHDVLFSAMSSIQDNSNHLRVLMQKAVKNTMFFVFPLLAALLTLSYPLFDVLYGEKWLPTVPYVRIFCIAFIFFPLTNFNTQVIQAKGKFGTILIQEIIDKIVILLSIVIAFKHGPLGLTWSIVVCNAIGYITRSWPNGKLIGYSLWMQIKDVMPLFFCAMCAYGITSFTLPWLGNKYTQLLGGAFMFSLIYLFMARVFNLISAEILQIVTQRKFA